jgi:ADP-heptose:LPS heptosyltransferase
MAVELMEIAFWIEIVLNFFTAYKDPENFESVYQLKKIAQNYIVNENFILHLLAAFPYQLIWTYNPEDPDENVLRNIIMFKMLRLARLSTDFIPDDTLLTLL